jgi:moderate conductance mechanosensitive channel
LSSKEAGSLTIFRCLRAVVLLWTLFSGTLLAQETTPTQSLTADQTVAVQQLMVVLEDPQLRASLLAQLESLIAEPGTTAPAESAVTIEEAVAAPAEEPGLVDRVSLWLSEAVEALPSTTFGVPIEDKAAQAGAQAGSRLQAGLESGRLVGFLLWAVPALLAATGATLLLRRIGSQLTLPRVPVRKRAVFAGMGLQIVLHIVLFFLVSLPIGLLLEDANDLDVFVTFLLTIMLTALGTSLLLAALSLLAGWRGARLIRFCQYRFAPWLLAIIGCAVLAALMGEPDMRRLVGWSVADLAGLGFNLVAAVVFMVFIARHRLAIGRLIFGTAAHREKSDSVFANATRRLARHWQLLAYAFLCLSVVSIIAGRRDNDVLTQMLMSFGVVLIGLVVISILNRLTMPKKPKYAYRGTTMRQVMAAAVRRVVRLFADGLVMFAMVILLFGIWGFDLWRWITTEGVPATGPLFAALIVVATAWLIWVALDAWITGALAARSSHDWTRRRSSRVQTLLPLVRNGIMIILIVLTGIAVLANIGVDVTPLIAGAGVFGLALSFGSQQLVQDVITGIFILAEDTIAIGDSVSTGDRSGTVESISLRTIRLRDGDGALHSIPFSTVKALKNSSRNYGVLRPRFTIPSTLDPNVVLDEMRSAAATLREDPRFAGAIMTDITDLGIDEINPGAVVVSGSFRTSPSRQTELARAFNALFHDGLAARGIAIGPVG